MMKRLKAWFLLKLYLLIGYLDDEEIPTRGLNYARAADAVSAQTPTGKKAFFHFLCEKLTENELTVLKIVLDGQLSTYKKTQRNR